jgi:hypothetical protein
MCYQLVYMIFDFADEATLRDTARVGAFLDSLPGFHLPDESGHEGASAAWLAAVARGGRAVWIALENAKGLNLTFSIIGNNWRRLYLSIARADAGKPSVLRTFLDACEALYAALQPDYGYGLVALDVQPLPPPFEPDAGVKALYDYNFFGPKLAARLGQERVLSAPAQRTAALPDGGALLEVVDNPLANRKANTPKYQEIAHALGLDKIEQVS